MKYSGWRKYVVAGWALVETLLFAGLLYGWIPMVWVFKQEGVYEDLCPDNKSVLNTDGYQITVSYNGSTVKTGSNNYNFSIPSHMKDGTCKLQDDKFALAFTIGSALFCASSAFYGFITFKLGTRVTRLISMGMFIAGTLMLAFVDRSRPWLVFPGLPVMGLGGLPVLMTNAQISNLFDKGSSTFIGLLCGAYDASSAVMLLVKFAYESGIRISYSYGFLAALHCLVAISTFVFLPKDYIRQKVNHDETHDQENTNEAFLAKDDPDVSVYKQTTLPNEVAQKTEKRYSSLKSCIISDTYLLHVAWLCILQMRFYYFLGSMNSYLHRITENDKTQVSYFTDVMMYTMLGGCVSSPSAGIVYDWQRRLFQKSRTSLRRQLMPAVLPLGVASGLGILLSFLVMVPNVKILYITFIVMTLLRSFLYSVGTAYLTSLFPSEYFGVLYGIMIISGGLFGFLQFALFSWSQSYLNAPLHADILCVCLVTVSFIHPAYQWYKCREKT